MECFSTDAVLHAGSGECALYSQSGACQGLGVYVRDASLALRLLHCPNPPQPPLVSHTQHTLALLEQARGCEWLEHFMELCTSCMLKPANRDHKLSRPSSRKSFADALCASIANAVETGDHCGIEDYPRQTYGPIAIYRNFCRLNHSCRPSTRFKVVEMQACVQLLVTLPAGAPLTISYIDALQPVDLRQAELLERYAFVCKCERCQEEQAAGQGLDESGFRKELQCALDDATVLLFEQDQAEQCFMQSHEHVSKLCQDTPHPLGYVSVQLLTIMASAARICALLSAQSLGTAVSPWWSRAVCCRLIICRAVETAVISGETGLLSHASCNRQELCALTEAVLASMAKADAVATPAAAAAAGTASGPRGPALAQAQAEEVPRARNALWPPAQNEQSLWPLVQDEQLWSWATQASGLCWDAWLECMAQEHEQDLASFLTEVCPVFHAQAQRLAESPWLLTKRL